MQTAKPADNAPPNQSSQDQNAQMSRTQDASFLEGKSFNQTSLSTRMKDIPQQDIVAKRYNKIITKVEMLNLQNQMYMSENMLNFFIRYLQEKLMISKQQTQVLVVSTTFYKEFTNNNFNGTELNQNAASFYTKSYVGSGNTIFDRFAQMVVPIQLTEHIVLNCIISFEDKSVIIIDLSKGNLPKENNISKNMLQFLQNESLLKRQQPIAVDEWNVTQTDELSTITSYAHSALYVAYQIYIFVMNQQDLNMGEQVLKKFQQNLLLLFNQIGITKNQKNELDSLSSALPL